MNPNKALRVPFRPGGQGQVVNGFSKLRRAKIKHVAVREKVRKVEELWDQLPYILEIFGTRAAPARADIVEKSVSHIKLSALKGQGQP